MREETCLHGGSRTARDGAVSAAPDARQSGLLPPVLEAARCAVPVADSVPVTGREGRSAKAHPGELTRDSADLAAYRGTGPCRSRPR